MIPFVRLHLLRLFRRPIGSASILAALLLPATLVAGVHVLRQLSLSSGAMAQDAIGWGGSFLGLLVAIGAAGWIPASIAYDERAERRISMLRAANIDGLRAALALLVIASVVASVLSFAALLTSALLPGPGRIPLTIVVAQWMGGTLTGVGLGALGAAVQAFIGRAGWAVVNAMGAFMGAGFVAAMAIDQVAPTRDILLVLAMIAAVAIALSMAAFHLGERLNRVRLEIWS